MHDDSPAGLALKGRCLAAWQTISDDVSARAAREHATPFFLTISALARLATGLVSLAVFASFVWIVGLAFSLASL